MVALKGDKEIGDKIIGRLARRRGAELNYVFLQPESESIGTVAPKTQS